MCVYAYITELSTRLSVSQSAPLEYHSPSLPFSTLLFSSLLFFFLLFSSLLSSSFRLFYPIFSTGGYRGSTASGRRIRGGYAKRISFHFGHDSSLSEARQRLRDKIHSRSVGAGERLSRKLRSPLEACRHTPHSSRARHERLAMVRMRRTCRAV